MDKEALQELGFSDEQIRSIMSLHNDAISGNYVPRDKYVDVERKWKEEKRKGESSGDSSAKIDELQKDLSAANKRVKELNLELENNTVRAEKKFKLIEKLREKVVNGALDDALEKFNIDELEYADDTGDFANFDEKFEQFENRYTYMVKPTPPGGAVLPKPVSQPKPTPKNPSEGSTEPTDGTLTGSMQKIMEDNKYFKEEAQKTREAWGL